MAVFYSPPNTSMNTAMGMFMCEPPPNSSSLSQGVAPGESFPIAPPTIMQPNTQSERYTLAPVALNDLIMILIFALIVMFLVGVSGVHLPANVLNTLLVVFIVNRFVAGWLGSTLLIWTKGRDWF